MHYHFRYRKYLFDNNHNFVAFIEDLIKKIENNMYLRVHISVFIVGYTQGDVNA